MIEQLPVSSLSKTLPRPKISFYLSHPVQYISPLLRAINEKFEVKAYYFSDVSITGGLDKGFGRHIAWDVPLLEGYDYAFIKNYSGSKTISNKFFELINPGVFNHLFKSKTDIIVVNGWAYFSVVLTIIIARLSGKKVWLRAENPLHHELKKSRLILAIKKIILQYFLFSFVDKFLYIGSMNKQFFKYYGVKERDMIYTPYSVDNSFFNKQYLEYRKQKDLVLDQLNLPAGKKIILFSGKYIAQKRPLDLIAAVNQMQFKDCLLVMVGEGELRNEIETYIRTHNISNVVLTGFINQSAISKYYAVADVFVMSSGIPETWGLSVNEAMNFAVPVVVSKTCGCSYDLVHEGENGFTYDEGNIEQLSAHLDYILTDKDFSKRAGSISKEIISEFNYNVTVNNMYKAMQMQIINES